MSRPETVVFLFALLFASSLFWVDGLPSTIPSADGAAPVMDGSPVRTESSHTAVIAGFSGRLPLARHETFPESDVDSGPQVKRTEPFAGHAEPSPSYVFPPDDRERITPTTSYPWRTISKLYLYKDGDDVGQCSGAVIDAFHVLTAGHCVYLWEDGLPLGWADSIRVVPAMDGGAEPYGEAWATYLRTYTGWTENADVRHDWGLITLDWNIGLFTGWMGRMTAPSWDSVYTDILNTAGYPGDLGFGLNMYFASDSGCWADEYNHGYWLDTAGGQSGSPVWTYDGTDRYILTIHAYEVPDGSSCNFGTRLNREKFDTLSSWLSSDAPPTDYPDLTDAGSELASISPSMAAPGVTSLTITSGVQNRGTARSGGFYVSYHLSPDPNIEPWDLRIGELYVDPLEAFASRTITWQGFLPSGVSSGSYWVGWVIDSRYSVVEFDETNNYGRIESMRLTVDASPPRTVASLFGVAGKDGWYRSEVKVTLAATDSLSGVAMTMYRVDDGDWIRYTGAVLVDSDGRHAVEYYSVDLVGNQEEVNRISLAIDATAPETLVLIEPANGTMVHTSTITVRFRGADSLSGIDRYSVQLDEEPPIEIGTEQSHTFNQVADGAHRVQVKAFDRAGNVRTVTASVRVDTFILSPSGPYGSLPLLGLVGGLAVAAAAPVFLLRRRRRRFKEPSHPPPQGPPPPPLG